MRKSLIFLLLLSISLPALACSFAKESFCYTLEEFPERDIFSAEIIASDEDGITVAVLDLIRGTGIADTVRIWDGTDFECNGTFSLAAALIGEVGETYVLMPQKITTIINDWDVIGDYRWVDPYRFTPELRVEGEQVKGFIKGLDDAPASANIYETSYAHIRDELVTSGNCADVMVAADETSAAAELKVPNPFSGQLEVQLSGGVHCDYLRLLSLQGQLLLEKQYPKGSPASSPRLRTAHLPGGLYVLEIGYNGKFRAVRKVVKVE